MHLAGLSLYYTSRVSFVVMVSLQVLYSSIFRNKIFSANITGCSLFH